MRFWTRKPRSQGQGEPWIHSFLVHRQQGNRSLLRTSWHIFLLRSQLRSELTAEFISLMRTAYQGYLGVRVCVCLCVSFRPSPRLSMFVFLSLFRVVRRLSVRPTIRASVCPSLRLVRPCVHPSCPPVCQPASQPVSLSVRPSVRLFACIE